jgi:alkylated DNA repair dioxygenase AlkB
MQVNLFQADSASTHQNLLPKDGCVHYCPAIFSQDRCASLMVELMQSLDWRVDQLYMFGKLITTKRKVAWYGDNPYEYKYSNISKKAVFWTPELLQIKLEIEQLTGETFNSCLANLYHDGSEGMAYHSDAEKDLKKHGAIVSVSFGAERNFLFKHKTTKELITVFLEHGSLLMMKNETQDHWLHRLPLTKKTHAPRVNLTFRTIVN